MTSDKFPQLTMPEKTVIHDALIIFLDSEDYSDGESVIIAELLENLEQNKNAAI